MPFSMNLSNLFQGPQISAEQNPAASAQIGQLFGRRPDPTTAFIDSILTRAKADREAQAQNQLFNSLGLKDNSGKAIQFGQSGSDIGNLLMGVPSTNLDAIKTYATIQKAQADEAFNNNYKAALLQAQTEKTKSDSEYNNQFKGLVAQSVVDKNNAYSQKTLSDYLSPSQQKSMMDIEDRKRVQEAAGNDIKEAAKTTLDSIAKVEEGSQYFGPRSYEPGLFGLNKDKVKFDAYFDNLKSRLITNLMTQLKNASRTGATGFGQLNKDELKVIQDGATALKKTMSWDDAKPILDGMKVKLNKVVSNQSSPTSSGSNGRPKITPEQAAALVAQIEAGQ